MNRFITEMPAEKALKIVEEFKDNCQLTVNLTNDIIAAIKEAAEVGLTEVTIDIPKYNSVIFRYITLDLTAACYTVTVNRKASVGQPYQFKISWANAAASDISAHMEDCDHPTPDNNNWIYDNLAIDGKARTNESFVLHAIAPTEL